MAENQITPVAAVVLAGGASSRMGASKALLPFAGQPLAARVLTRLKRQADTVYLNVREHDPVLASFGAAPARLPASPPHSAAPRPTAFLILRRPRAMRRFCLWISSNGSRSGLPPAPGRPSRFPFLDSNPCSRSGLSTRTAWSKPRSRPGARRRARCCKILPRRRCRSRPSTGATRLSTSTPRKSSPPLKRSPARIC